MRQGHSTGRRIDTRKLANYGMSLQHRRGDDGEDEFWMTLEWGTMPIFSDEFQEHIEQEGIDAEMLDETLSVYMKAALRSAL